MNFKNKKIMIVDDTEENIDILVELLEDQYDLRVAMSSRSFFSLIEKELPDLILLDVMLPDMDGYEVCKKIKDNEETKHIPVIFITALSQVQNEEKGLELGAVDYITKPFNPSLVKSRVKNQMIIKVHQNDLEELVKERTKKLELFQDVIIKSMGIIAEYRDPETGGHIKRTQNYVKLLAEHLRNKECFKEYLTEERIEALYRLAPLHDVGKVGVSDNILLKPGKLTKEEFETMKEHTTYGRDIIKKAEEELKGETFLEIAKEIAYTHQEKWNGSGYPQGLKENEIPISGRLMAIADVYDALISRRVYKPPFKHEKAVKIIKEGKGTHFDPVMVDAFLELEDKFRIIALEYADFDEERENLK